MTVSESGVRHADPDAALGSRFARLGLVASALAAPVTFDEVVEIVVRQAVAGSRASAGILATVDGGALRFVASVGMGPDDVARLQVPVPIDVDVPIALAARGEPFYSPSSTDRIHRYPVLAEVANEIEATAYLPVTFGGDVLAVLGVGWRDVHEFGTDDREYLHALAALVAQAMQRIVGDAARSRLGVLTECDGVGVVAGSGHRLVEANDALLAMVGRTRQDLADGLDWRSLVPTGQGPPSGTASTITDLVRPDGTLVPVQIIGGQLLGHDDAWFAVVLDVADRRRLERDLADLAALLDTVLMAAPVGIAVVDRDQRFVHLNEALARLNAVPAADHVGRRITDVLAGDAGTRISGWVDEVLDTGRPVLDREVAGTNAAGTDTEVVAHYYPVGPPDDVRGVGIAVVDVTERNRAQRSATRALERHVEAQGTALAELQRMLLPEVPSLPGLAIAARYVAAETIARVGGDWYDCFALDADTVVLAVGDAAGHGLEAVTTMDLARNVIRGCLFNGDDLTAALAHANRALASRHGDFATAALVRVDLARGRVEHASAGHLPPLLVHEDGAWEALSGTTGALLGPYADACYEAATTAVAPGDSIVLYTDGLIERRGDTSVDDGIGRLATAVQARRSDVDGLIAASLAGGSQEDDLCLLVATFLGR